MVQEPLAHVLWIFLCAISAKNARIVVRGAPIGSTVTTCAHAMARSLRPTQHCEIKLDSRCYKWYTIAAYVQVLMRCWTHARKTQAEALSQHGQFRCLACVCVT